MATHPMSVRQLRAELNALDEFCACGHTRTWHDHYRAGTDCASCGRAACPRYRPPRRRTRLGKIIFFWRNQ